MQCKDPDKPIALARMLNDELSQKKNGYLPAAMKYFELFLLECCREYLRQHSEATADVSQNHSDAQIEKIRSYIDGNYRMHLTLDELAAICRYNPNYLCRRFKEYTGRSLFDYIIHRRIEAAMILLRTTDDKVLSISGAVGFNDLAHFNRTFKKISDCSPRDYRNRWR